MRISVLIAACVTIAVVPANAADRSIEESLGDWRISCFDDDFTEYRDCSGQPHRRQELVTGATRLCLR